MRKVSLLFLLLSTLPACNVSMRELKEKVIRDPGTAAEVMLGYSLTGDSISEGEQITGAVSLNREPLGKVVIKLKASVENQLAIDPAELIFDTNDWENPKSFSIAALSDTEEDLDRSVDVVLDTSASDDPNFKIRGAPRFTLKTINVPSEPALTRSGESGFQWTSGGGGSGTFLYSFDDTPIEEGTTTTLTQLTPEITAGVHILNLAEVDTNGKPSKVVHEAVIVSSPIMKQPRSADTAALNESLPLVHNPLTLLGDVTAGSSTQNVKITWNLISTPTGATAKLQSTASQANVSLLPDAPGTYTVERIVTYGSYEFRSSLSFIVESFGAASLVRSSVTGDHSCAIASSKVYCWGADDRFQLGIDFSHGGGDAHNHQNSLRPERVKDLEAASDLALGGSHSCALMTADGSVYCWGDAQKLQLGTYNAATRSATPRKITGLSNVSAIAAGKEHSCAILSDKSIKCWGEGSSGELGDGNSQDSGTPVAVSGITTAEELSCGSGFCCARLTNKTVKCWGRGDLGQLGNAATTTQATPVAATGVTMAAQLAVGESHACVINDDASILCWGQGLKQQLGNGSTSDASTPTRVTNY